MNDSLAGKRLLVLGSTPDEIPLIKRAQQLGVYAIVTDYNTDYSLSPAKMVADEAWDISWSDVDALAERCAMRGVDGVTAGFSEIRIENLIKLCGKLGLPCYANEGQLAITRDKVLFKEECRKHGVPTIKEYDGVDSVESYPVIVKPVDRAGSIGVGIAHDQGELERAFAVATEKSLCGKVIIEDYVTDSVEMDAHYAICDGEVTLLATDDIIPAARNASEGKVVQSAWLYPSRYEGSFLEAVDPALRRMIEAMGIRNGTIFFSGFANDAGRFAFFECGFRLWGEQEFAYDLRTRGINYLDIYIHHALTGSSKSVERRGKIEPDLKGAALNLYVQGGAISEVEGFDEIAKERDCVLCIDSARVGQECPSDGAILVKAGLVGFASESPLVLMECVEKAYGAIHIKNEEGADMLYDRVSADEVGLWWGEA